MLKLALLCCWLAGSPALLFSQSPLGFSDRGAGLRIGIWNVELPAGADASRSPHFDLYLQRSLNEKIAMENSLSAWWSSRRTIHPIPGAGQITTTTYVLPLMAALKFYPLEIDTRRLQPFFLAGAGIALGVESQSESAIGGGGTTIVTGLGARFGLGAEFRIGRNFGVSALGSYQWLHFGEELGTTDTYDGVGVAGGLTYRFQP